MSIGDRYSRSARGDSHARTDRVVQESMDLVSEFSDITGRSRRAPPPMFLSADPPVGPIGFDGDDEAGDDKGGDGGVPPNTVVQPAPTPYGKDLKRDGRDEEDYDPRSPSGRGRGGPRCVVRDWGYPVTWAPEPDDGDVVDSEDSMVGFYFQAKIEFKEDPDDSTYCLCCVFRQFIKKTFITSGPIARDPPSSGWKLDMKGGNQYGGSRKDGSTSNGKSATPPDSSKGEGAQTWDKCKLEFDDSPGVPIESMSGGGSLTYDFVGVVYDRCNSWAYVDSRRFILTREFELGFDESDPEEHKRMINPGGTSRATKNVPAGSGKDAWDPSKKGKDGKERTESNSPCRERRPSDAA